MAAKRPNMHPRCSKSMQQQRDFLQGPPADVKGWTSVIYDLRWTLYAYVVQVPLHDAAGGAARRPKRRCSDSCFCEVTFPVMLLKCGRRRL